MAEKKATKKVAKAETVAKKTATKSTTKKTTTTKKATVEKKSLQHYIDVINWKKWEAHNMNWLYIEINANDLLTEVEAGVNNVKTVCAAMLDTMLEGDGFIVEPKTKTKVSASLTVRYYCDNLSESSRKYLQGE